MAPKYHPTPLSGGDRKALTKELGKARAMAKILTAQSAEMRAKGEATIQQADRLLCESWNERMWSDGDRPHENRNARKTKLIALSDQWWAGCNLQFTRGTSSAIEVVQADRNRTCGGLL
jgi:hypothetical protein